MKPPKKPKMKSRQQIFFNHNMTTIIIFPDNSVCVNDNIFSKTTIDDLGIEPERYGDPNQPVYETIGNVTLKIFPTNTKHLPEEVRRQKKIDYQKRYQQDLREHKFCQRKRGQR